MPQDSTSQRVLDFPVMRDHRGSLTFIEAQEHVPFEIARVFYIYDVPDGQSRAGHALKHNAEVLIALSGSFDVLLNDGREQTLSTLSSPDKGIYVAPMRWIELTNFSAGAICLVLASDPYSENGYISDFESFKSLVV